MSAIHLDHMSFSYTSAVEVFVDVSEHIGEGWTGVVGPNGAGKSTLLALITGDLEPIEGQVILDPAGATVTRCHQEVDTPSIQIESFAVSTDGEARRWMGLLKIDPEAFARWDTLSPGERKRWQLGAALATDPHILLLDEPTNHLDAEGRNLVESALGRFRGVGMVISHDRSFLDRLTSRTLRIRPGELRLWSGSYSTAHRAWTAEEELDHNRYLTARKKEKALRRRLGDERRKAEEKTARFRRTLRRADPADHDARSLAAKSKHESGEIAGQRRRTVVRAGMERAAETARDLAPWTTLGGSIFFDFEPSPKRRLLEYSGPLRVGETMLVPHLDMVVGRDDRIRLAGPNGAGKSTLLAALYASSGLPLDRLLYLPQELTRDEGVRLLESLDTLPRDRRGRVLSIVASLGVDPEQLLLSQRPSPGEVRKLALALGLGVNVWGLLLDEPTNHLDLPAVERVESALIGYPGAIVLVTHDETFAAETTTTLWHLEDGHLTVSTSPQNRSASPPPPA